MKKEVVIEYLGVPLVISLNLLEQESDTGARKSFDILKITVVDSVYDLSDIFSLRDFELITDLIYESDIY